MQHGGTGVAWQLHLQVCTAQHYHFQIVSAPCILWMFFFTKVITQDIAAKAAVQAAVQGMMKGQWMSSMVALCDPV